MKKSAYILYGLVLLLSACSREEESLFNQSAAERLNEMREKTMGYLTAAPNGWELRYFPYAQATGYALLCHFDEDMSVMVAAKNSVVNDQYKTERSMWDIDFTQSVVLTFNSYNPLLSIFADPMSDGIGYGGDYEFVILSSSPEAIKLKGKKTGAYIDLLPLDANQNWEDYYTQIDRINERTFLGNEGLLMYYNGYDTLLTMTYQDGGQMTYTRNDMDTTLGFVITPSGIHFYSSTPNLTGAETKDFVLNETLTRLVCTTDNNYFFSSYYDIVQYFDVKLAQHAYWRFNPDYSDLTTQAALQVLNQTVGAKGATISKIAFENVQEDLQNKFVLFINYLVNNHSFEGYLQFTKTSEDEGELTLTYDGSYSSSITPLLLRIDSDPDKAAQQIADLFEGTFALTSFTGSELNMTQMYLTSTADEARKIYLIADLLMK